MLLSIIYLVSVILLIVSFLLINKSYKKQNLVLWIFTSLIFMFCYNILIVYVLSLIYIKSTLLVLSIVNLIISFLLYIFTIRGKSIQKYYINKLDIVALFIILIIVIVIGYFRFGFPFKIVYETFDPGTHFWTSMDFFRESILLNKADTVIDFSSRVFGSYVNTGILFKIFYPVTGYINLYMIYIIFDLFMLFMAGAIFYLTARYLYTKNKFLTILIGSILYLTGYPLNSMIFGFFYSGHIVTLFIVLILLFKFLDHKDFNNRYILVLITLLNIGICFTYYLYTPIVFISEVFYLIYKFKYKQKLKIKNISKIIGLIVVFPCILTCLYFVIPYIGNKQNSFFYQINLYGYCYNTYFSNFIWFIPPIIYYLINMFKKKETNFEICLLFPIIFFIFIIIFLSMFHLADQYYASKFFYLLWLLCFILMFNLFNQYNVNKTFTHIYMITFCCLVLLSTFNIENRLYDVNDGFGNRLESSNILNVYSYNIDKMKYSNITFTLKEIDIIRKLYDINATNVVSNYEQSFNAQRVWLNAFFWNEKLDYPENELYNYIVEGTFFDPVESGNYLNMDDNYKYFVLFYRSFSIDKWKYYHNIYPFEVQRRWDENFRKDYTINRKIEYDATDRSTCYNCEFIDFDDGVIIIKS